MILLIDNYDSFVYNLARYFRELGCETQVMRNDAVSIADVARLRPAALVISPGPCTPSEAGISVELIRAVSGSIPILGVCLGHQAIGQAFGARIARAPRPVHGVRWPIRHEATSLFEGLPNPLQAGRYHSLCLTEETLPSELRVTARSEDGVVMAIEHRARPVFGVQFHPESVLTDAGHRLLANFLSIAGLPVIRASTGDYSPPADFAEPLEYTNGDGVPLHW
jgi:anthranilate synthase/aminodeoxychorismate synthase-like glutamine amidotransferase